MQDGRRVGDWIADRYEIFDIHTGGMGVVYVVYDHKGHRAIASWRSRPSATSSCSTRSRTSASSPSAGPGSSSTGTRTSCRAYSVQEIQGKPYAVLELVTGGDLRRWIGTSRLDLRQILRFGPVLSGDGTRGDEGPVLSPRHQARKPPGHRRGDPQDHRLRPGQGQGGGTRRCLGGADDPIPLAETGADLLAFNPEHSQPIRWDDRPRPSLDHRGDPGVTIDLPGAGHDPLDPDFDPDDVGATIDLPGHADPYHDLDDTLVDPSQTIDLPPRVTAVPLAGDSGEGSVGSTMDWSGRSERPANEIDEILATVDWKADRPADRGSPGDASGDTPMADSTMTQDLEAVTGEPRGRG